MGSFQKFSHRLFVVSAPSGAGKSSMVERVVTEIPQLVDCITCTTRAPRVNESQGHPYFFLNREEFEVKVSEGYFCEWATVHGHFYGTPLNQLTNAWSQGSWVIMDVDVQGARTLTNKFVGATSIFILPPSLEELKRRLHLRDQGKTSNIDLRLKNAELELAQAPIFQFQIVNDDFDRAYDAFKNFIVETMKKG
jgi:guanylate kinase